MAVKGGDLIHVGNQVLLDRAQTAGPGQVNIPTEKIYELGNYKSVGTVLDIPDLSFPLESFDASAELESMLVGKNFATDAAGTEYDISKCLPVDVASQFKKARPPPTPSTSRWASRSRSSPRAAELPVRRLGERPAVGHPQGRLDLLHPGLGLRPGGRGHRHRRPDIVLAHDRLPVQGRRRQRHPLRPGGHPRSPASACATAPTTPRPPRRRHRHAAVTVTLVAAVRPRQDPRLLRLGHGRELPAGVPRRASATRPAAIRGRNIRVFVGGTDVTDEWTGVQSVHRRLARHLDRDLEFGNSEVVSQDYDVPTVTGSIDFKPRDATALHRIAQIAGAASETEVVGALQQAVLPLDIVLYSPTDGSVLKTLYVPDARFTVPGYSGRVQQKLTVTFNFESDTGQPEGLQGRSPLISPSGWGWCDLLGAPKPRPLRNLGPGGFVFPPARPTFRWNWNWKEPLMARRLRQVVDLYVTGEVAVLSDGSPCGYSRSTPSSRTPPATRRRSPRPASPGDPRARLRRAGQGAHVLLRGRHRRVPAKVVDAKVAESMPQDLRAHAQRPRVDRALLTSSSAGLEDTAPAGADREELLEAISNEYTAEIGRAPDPEREFLDDQVRRGTEDDLWDDYLEWYIEPPRQRADDGRVPLHQVLFGVRVCDGDKGRRHLGPHELCAGHQERMFIHKDEVRGGPRGADRLLLDAADDVEMTVREAKNSDRQGSSSDSSPLPSEAEESTASTPDETPVAPLVPRRRRLPRPHRPGLG
jgi:hypothetical protein